MFKNLTLGIVAMLLSVVVSAQQRIIARGATEGELYYSINWLDFSDPGGIDSIIMGFFHITENGKKMELNHSTKKQEPDAGIGADLPMQLNYIMADATPDVVYNADWYMAYEDGRPYVFERLWFSDDYGKTWTLRDDGPEYQSRYYVSNFEGLIFRGGGGVHQSDDYGNTWNLLNEKGYFFNSEPYFEECEFISIVGRGFYHTYDCFENYINITIDSVYAYGYPDIFRGGLPGEVYIFSGFPDRIYKVSFSSDTGYHFRVALEQRGFFPEFMSDRKAGDFYIVKFAGWEWREPETRQNWMGYNRTCIEYYTDYGETLAGIYCHDFPIDYAERSCAGVLDMEAEIVDKNNVSLHWNAPETATSPIAYRVYQSDILLQELSQTTYVDENLPNGNYVYFVRAVYADSCESLSYNIAKIKIQATGIESPPSPPEGRDVRVYPNPTGEELWVECRDAINGVSTITNIEIFDLMGRTVGANLCVRSDGSHRLQIGASVNISHLPTGMYFVRITTEKGTVTKKIIKK